MGTIDLPKSPSAYHTAAPSPHKLAGGFRNAPSHDDLQQAVTRLLEEETGIILRYLMGKLPTEALDSKGSLKEKLYSFVNRHYQELFNRYTASDDQDETTAFVRHTSGEIAELLRSMGGAGKFNAGEIEKAAGNRRGINDLEIHVNNILRQKADTGVFLSDAAIGSIVKCVFRDNALRPRTVTDVKLAVNIPDSELIGSVFYSHAAAKYLIKDVISRHIIESIDRGINGSAGQDPGELIAGLLSETGSAGFNLSNVRESVRKSADIETIRTCGFTIAVNALVAILDNSKLSYQFIENIKNGRELILREYEDNDPAGLPDEHYEMRLCYFDRDRLIEDRKTYDAQVKDFEQKVQHLWDLIEVNYQDSKPVFKVNDFEDLAKKNKGRIRDLLKHTSGEGAQEITREPVGVRFARMHERIKNMYEFLYPVERRIMEDRLAWLERENSRLDFQINPRHLRPGLLIDVDITSIKRRKTTLNSVASALGEFLHGVYRCFQDAAGAV